MKIACHLPRRRAASGTSASTRGHVLTASSITVATSLSSTNTWVPAGGGGGGAAVPLPLSAESEPLLPQPTRESATRRDNLRIAVTVARRVRCLADGRQAAAG